MKLWITLICLQGLLAGAAQAQSVWRCGPDGRDYSDTPCQAGRALDLAQARPAADLHSAHDNARKEKALAAQLTGERLQREAKPTAGLAGIRSSRAAAEPAAITPKPKARAKGRRQLEDADTWRAIAPASPRGRG